MAKIPASSTNMSRRLRHLMSPGFPRGSLHPRESQRHLNTDDPPDRTCQCVVTEKEIQEANREAGSVPTPPSVSCCGSGCGNCGWLVYMREVKDFYKHDESRIEDALSQIADPDYRAFVRFEINKGD